LEQGYASQLAGREGISDDLLESFDGFVDVPFAGT
jgi:hypothetical protein